jgi:hypothetical protein
MLNLRLDQTAIYDLCKIVYLIIFVGHFCGCAYYFLSNNLGEDKRTWITALDLHEAGWFQKYLTAFYWAVVTIITVGYGDVIPI